MDSFVDDTLRSEFDQLFVARPELAALLQAERAWFREAPNDQRGHGVDRAVVL